MQKLYDIRAWQPGDVADLHAINQASVPGVGSVSENELADLLDMSEISLVAERGPAVLGFVLCLTEGLPYQSPNYRWFQANYPAFAYVDRIAVSEAARNLGLGQALYAALETELAACRPVLTAEVNEQPPNPGSLRFHQRLGFRQVGRQDNPDKGTVVAFLEKPLKVQP